MHPGEFEIDTVDMVGDGWREKDFAGYDVVFHVAGIAHADVGHVTDEIKARYYEINTDLAIETAKKAKSEGVKQFVFMSSAIVYGDSAPYGKTKRITKGTEPMPADFYGDSKWQADKGIRELNDETFALHFAKGIREYKGIYQHLYNSFSIKLNSKYKYINFEQDLGKDTLRQAKSTYYPDEMRKKYRVALIK